MMDGRALDCLCLWGSTDRASLLRAFRPHARWRPWFGVCAGSTFAFFQESHEARISVTPFILALENWQSEFLQLLWQGGWPAILLHVGSPQSKVQIECLIDGLH
jgi:hypothetical protein